MTLKQPNSCFNQLNLENPELTQKLHISQVLIFFYMAHRNNLLDNPTPASLPLQRILHACQMNLLEQPCIMKTKYASV